jgi:CubicO group peptidase (beta-lactamase class C family)
LRPGAIPKDPRHAITIDNLLRMNSGIELGQSLFADWRSAFDEAAFAEAAELGTAQGTRWNYTNGNTMLLARMIRDQAGGDAASVLRFAHRELFDKLGMKHARSNSTAPARRSGRAICGRGARLGALRPALPRRRRGGRRAHIARRLGRLFGAAHPRQRNLWLRRRLLDQSQHDRRGRQAHQARHAVRLLHGARHPGAVHTS